MKISIKYLVLSIFVITFLLYPTPYTLYPAFAQACPVQSTNSRVQNGLISTADIDESKVSGTNKFGSNTGKCVVDSKASFAPFKIPTYADLKSLYYTQSKAAKTDATPGSDIANQGTLRSALNSYDVILIRGNLNIRGNLGGDSKTGIVFVDGNLNFSSTTFTFGDNQSGVVFIVSGDINIDKDVTQIDAVLIAQGHIYTAGAGCSHNFGSRVSASQLIINGSLVSLNGDNNIEFCRTLGDTNQTTAAEVINQQPKYLVILKDLFSDTLQKWSEIQ